VGTDLRKRQATNKLKQTGKTRKTGTKVTFHPDPTIFDKTEYSFDTLAQRLRELAFLNKGLKITLTDERTEKTAEFKFTGGITEFCQTPEPRKIDAARFADLHRRQARERRNRNRVAVQRYLRAKTFLRLRNTINTVDGGTHLSGFRSALTRSINNFASAAGMLKEQKDEVTINGRRRT